MTLESADAVAVAAAVRARRVSVRAVAAAALDLIAARDSALNCFTAVTADHALADAPRPTLGASRPSSSASSRPPSGVASSNTGGPSHTRYDHLFPSTPSEVRITRRHHPLEGQAFAVVRGGPREFVIRAVDGVVMRLPRAWTDADGVTHSGASPDAVFTVEAIRALVELIEALRGRRTR